VKESPFADREDHLGLRQGEAPGALASWLAALPSSSGCRDRDELKEKKARVETLCTQPVRLWRSIVPGGGVALVARFSAVDKLIATLKATRRLAHKLFAALSKSASQIVANAGEEARLWCQVLRVQGAALGYNPRPARFEGPGQAGVIDPTKVTRTALHNAASIAALLLTTEALIVEISRGQGGSGGRRPARMDACTKNSSQLSVHSSQLRVR